MINPRAKAPELSLSLINGTQWKLSEQDAKQFTMIVVYRGLHCPVCKNYLKNLQDHIDEFIDRGVNVVAVSSDTEEKANKAFSQWKIGDLPVGYQWSLDEARKWGLFISDGINDEPDQFIEPGLFLIRSDQSMYYQSIQNMPFARPSFEKLLKAIDFVVEKDYPARGEA
ncbi:peroxiredoxin-like family protein [Gangjinia marincola]|uniref:Peroxiredoxin-like family protein n=1 Tax=Gangjinia marincola TaxID=578463 RepID=A0ABN1MF00_9FLAO